MPSDAAKKRAAKKKAAAANRGKPAKKGDAIDEAEPVTNGSSAVSNGSSVCAALAALKLSDRSCTGVLTSHAVSRDLHIDNFSMRSHGAELFVDTKIELNCGRRYGLLGLNGCGKLTLLLMIGQSLLYSLCSILSFGILVCPSLFCSISQRHCYVVLLVQ